MTVEAVLRFISLLISIILLLQYQIFLSPVPVPIQLFFPFQSCFFSFFLNYSKTGIFCYYFSLDFSKNKIFPFSFNGIILLYWEQYLLERYDKKLSHIERMTCKGEKQKWKDKIQWRQNQSTSLYILKSLKGPPYPL